MKPGGNTRVLQGFFDIQMVCPSLLTEAERQHAIAKKQDVRQALIDRINGDEEFSDSLTQFTSNPENVKLRIDEFCKILREI